MNDSRLLAPYAVSELHGVSRRFPEPPPQHRTELQRDRDRVLHSSAFRRLEYKTQVFVNHEGDMFRTRLTHSLEVSQISRTAARCLRLNEDLVETLSLAHDLGHTPFGHAGQEALNACMREHGGFEHNLQSLRIVDLLEQRYPEFDGLNLTFDTREGVLKHCSRHNALELGAVASRFLDGTSPSLEAQLANLADEIAYNNHDVDDGIRAGLLDLDQLRETTLFGSSYRTVVAQWPSLESGRLRYAVIRHMIGRELDDLIQASTAAIAAHAPRDIEQVRSSRTPLIKFSAAMLEQHLELKSFLRDNLYMHYRVLRMARKAQRVVSELFQALVTEPRLLPQRHARRARDLETIDPVSGRARAVADYVAGMTDRYALSEHERLFKPGVLT